MNQQKTQSYWGLVWRQFKKNKLSVGALYLVSFLVIVAVCGNLISNNKPVFCIYEGDVMFPAFKDYGVSIGLTEWQGTFAIKDWKDLEYETVVWPLVPYKASSVDLMNPVAEPSSEHFLGTDETGRDVLAGLIEGASISLSIGLVSMGVALTIGIFLGCLAGYYGGWVDIALSRLIEVVITFPSFFLIIIIAALYESSIWLVMLAIGLTGWTGIARFTRGEFLRVRNQEFVSAAQALGFRDTRIIFRHILPNALAPVLISAAFGIASAILTESSLSFLGFGVPPTQVTWGSILAGARGSTYAWWLAIFPGMMVFITVTAYNLLGEGIRDALDPKLKT